MKLLAKCATAIACLALLPALAHSQPQPDPYGVPDTLYAEITRIDDNNMSITLSYFNDEDIVGLQIPFKMAAGDNQIVADSAVFTGGRLAEAKWTELRFRPDTAIQCVTLGLMANIGPSNYTLPPGRGRIATVFVSSLEQEPIDDLSIDTTTTSPGLYLMAITNLVIGKGADTTRLSIQERQIIPQWVVKQAE
jgi:hypothetical protein